MKIMNNIVLVYVYYKLYQNKGLLSKNMSYIFNKNKINLLQIIVNSR